LCVFFFNKIGEQEGGTGSAWRQWRVGGLAKTMYTCVNKCKNDKIIFFLKKEESRKRARRKPVRRYI
jgi:hypothetical protein